MVYQLVAISGGNKGAFWELDERGIVLGRDTDCDVAIREPVVSRRHCRIVHTSGQVYLEDLGSLNSVLVNGAPCAGGPLRAGDEIAVGSERFLLTKTTGAEPHETGKKNLESTDTWPWGKAEPVSLKIDSAKPALKARPGTIQDLAMLYSITRELSASATMPDLIATLRRHLAERFTPQRLWIALVHNEDDLTFFDTPESDAHPPIEAIQKALRERHGLLVPGAAGDSGRTFMLVTPVAVGNVNVAVIALHTETPHGFYTEEDLRLLVLLGQSLAPLICVLENIEQLQRDNTRLRARAGESLTLAGKSRAIGSVRAQTSKAAKSNLNVLITGETGTGKELVARMVHAQSARRAQPLVVVNCAAIPRDLFESQLFGYEKGAFTGADEASVGLLAQAHGGALFLDEIGDLSLDNQARILRAIEYGTFLRIGAKEETCVDIRVISATNKDIAAAIKNGTFREDLCHRLNGFEIHIPPLRERPSDVPILAEHFFEMHKEHAKRPLAGIAPEVLASLRARSWPGNVRELCNCIQRAISVARHDVIQPRDIAGAPETPQAGVKVDKTLSMAEIEKRHIIETIGHCGGNIPEAAKMLQIGRSTLYKKIDEYGIAH